MRRALQGESAPAVAVGEVVLPVVVVMVVLVAEQDQVVQVGQAAVGPVPDVVGGALGGSPATALDDAVPITGHQSAEQPAADDPGGPADVERVVARGLLQDDQVDDGVAGQPAQRAAGQRSGVAGDAGGGGGLAR